jgi:hypothetical protein
MIVVKVELWPKGDGRKAKEIGRSYIANVGGNRKKGNYEIAVCRRGSKRCPLVGKTKAVREGKVENFPRLSYNVWRLVLRALLSAFPEEK